MDKSVTQPELILPHAVLLRKLAALHPPLNFKQNMMKEVFGTLYEAKQFKFGELKLAEDTLNRVDMC